MSERLIEEINRLQYRADTVKSPAIQNQIVRKQEELEYQLYLASRGEGQ